MHAAALFDPTTPKFNMRPINDLDILDIFLGTMRKVICSMSLAQKLLARKKALLSYDAEQQAKVPKAKVVPFHDIIVIGHSKLMCA